MRPQLQENIGVIYHDMNVTWGHVETYCIAYVMIAMYYLHRKRQNPMPPKHLVVIKQNTCIRQGRLASARPTRTNAHDR